MCSCSSVALSVKAKPDRFHVPARRDGVVNFHAPTRFQEVGIFLCIQRYISDGYLVSVAVWKMVARKRDPPSADAVCQRANSVSSSGEYSVTVGCQWPEHKPKIVSPLHRRLPSWLGSFLSACTIRTATHGRSFVVAATPECLQLQMHASISCFPPRGFSRPNQRFVSSIRYDSSFSSIEATWKLNGNSFYRS